ncbi:hypothetical protein MPSEU_000700900 [Mayamaea pseudoterrestris]|nr:hypothetical protein MPSEU_000700900 [Mayamaea pseudoterrestris]
MSKNWLDRFTKPKNEKSKGSSNVVNPLAGLFGPRTFHGEGKSLGGTLPGKVIAVELSEAGSLGMSIEKRSNSQKTAIISMVVPDSQAAKAGLERGDILCYAGSNGEEEIMYDVFVELAKSTQRPICFEVRRVPTVSTAGNDTNSKGSAEAFARKQAVVAAAEAREKALKNKQKPIRRGYSQEERVRQEEARRQQEAALPDDAPKTEESRLALEAAKKAEAETAERLGYNPYETNRVTAGQARNVVVGAIGSSDASDGKAGAPSLPSSQTPKNVLQAAHDDEGLYEEAFEKLVTLNDHASVVAAINILRTLIINATTKGQGEDEEASIKFRRVRLANPKIKESIVDLDGALNILLSTGFDLIEKDGESVMMYPRTSHVPDWLPMALKQMEQYALS